MSDFNERQRPDRLEQASQSLRDAEVPPGPPSELIAATIAAVETRHSEAVASEQGRRLQRRRRIMLIMKYGGVPGLVAAALIVALAWPPTPSPAEEVKKALRKVEQANSMRAQVEMITPDGKISSKSYRQGGKMRTEAEPIGLTVIVDAKTKKALMLMPKAKLYRTIDLEKDELTAKMMKTVSSHMDAFKIPPDDKVKSLTDEYLDGRKTKVYEIKGVDIPDLKMKADLKVWIDPRSTLPVKSQIDMLAGDKKYTTVYTFLGFDEELDPKLFDMTVPEGFKLMEEPKKDK